MANTARRERQARRWLLPAKAQWPGVVSGYYRRSDLLDLIEPLRPLTVLRAPSGFGKTCLLADVFQRWRDGGRIAAWLTVDEDDAPGIVDAYLAMAFKLAGLPLADLEEAWRDDHESAVPHRARRRTELLFAAIAAHAAPCLLVLDDVERLAHGETLDSVNFLLQSGPPNLHIAFAMRDNPGIDLPDAGARDEGAYLTTDELRFTAQQIDSFFEGDLSLRELAALEKRTEGWPVALRILRNLRAAAGKERLITVERLARDQLTAEWFGERLLADLRETDRNLLLDLALFDWITASLAQEALREDDIRGRMERLVQLEGLLLQGENDTLRLNPLLREYCAAKHREQNLARYQFVHGRIAEAEAREGRVAQALRHARESGDSTQVGRLLEEAGGVRLWARFGVKGLIAVNEFLTDHVIDAFPRVALVRCTVLVLQSRFAEAFTQYTALKAKTEDFAKDRQGGDDEALRADHVLVQCTLAGFSCMPLASRLVRETLNTAAEMVGTPGLDPVVAGALHLSLCMAHGQRARFVPAEESGLLGKAAFARAGAGYGGVFINLAVGAIAMAQGHVRDAAICYGRGAPTAIADVLSWELEHERTCNPPGAMVREVREVPAMPPVGGLEVYAAFYGVTAELAPDNHGALFSVEQALAQARKNNLLTLVRFLSALRVSWLVRDGLGAEAERAWREDDLPTDSAGILDLDRQSWREMEAVACGRIRLLCFQHDLEAARQLVRELCQCADERGLQRVLMNAVALSVAVELRCGDMRNAVQDLADLLRLAEHADYVRSLAREREAVLEVFPALLADDSAKDVHQRAEDLLKQLQRPADAPIFTARELAMLRAFGTGGDKDAIAANLGTTTDNLQLDLDDLYRKIGTKDPAEFARLAQETAGTLPRGARRSWRGSTRGLRV